ncbi:MAG: hypothetical protein LC796_16135 [Acidobacteria bacterium]|nr:hypothetical protein [Acidobacteriota bacterium]MCA1611925.1 hypothetical protein [Acidobacteriota bacterium]
MRARLRMPRAGSLALLASLFMTRAALARPPAGPAASADGEKPGTRVEVTELKRTSGGTVSLKFVLVNDGDQPVTMGYNFASADNHVKDHATVGGITLIDPAGKKKYFVVRDSEKNCVCSNGLKDVPKKSRVNLWAKFPAPPESVDKVGILIPHFQPLDDVPISK